MMDDEKVQEQEAREWAPPSPDETDPSSAGDAAALAQALEQKTKEAAEAQDKYLRTYADFDDYRKRMQRDLAEARKHATEPGDTNEGLHRGVELVYKQLRDALEKFGVTSFSAEGEVFDPAKHDAVMQEVTDRVPENTVVQVLQQGD